VSGQLYCPDDTRRAELRVAGPNGIDYLEVLPSKRTLLVHCFRPLPALSATNVLLEGGVRVTPVKVVFAYPAPSLPPGLLDADDQAVVAALVSPDHVLAVRTDSSGDYSTYTLRLVFSPTLPDDPPAGFDPVLSDVPFSFKVDCPNHFDCRPRTLCVDPAPAAPRIDYLARDYASFRQLMLDRLTVTAPAWTERNPADTGVALVEVLAYAADRLSYYQDAVATEAYLGTARKRASVRRHARLVDYRMHDGLNARAWICLEVGPAADGAELAAGTAILSGEGAGPTIAPEAIADAVPADDAVVFETVEEITLRGACNAIPFHTWADPNCCLPRGATTATLRGAASDLGLRAGAVLVFEEVLGGESGLPVDADTTHRHAVRLTADPVERADPLLPPGSQQVVDVAWGLADALPFPLCLREFGGQGAAVARGNVALADHGLRVADESLGESPPAGRLYRPTLARSGITFAAPVDDSLPAAQSLAGDPTAALPWIEVQGAGEDWTPARELLGSDRFAPEFVVELQEDGTAQLRFGDDVLARRPPPDSAFTATYRTGNGAAGNLGAESLRRAAPSDPALRGADGITGLRNPLPAAGGIDPEDLEQVRLNAPQAFRTQERAVTEADYADIAQRHPEVQRAAATRRWTGSWYTMFLTVDRRGGLPVDDAFRQRIEAFVDPFRLAGYDLEVESPRFVPLLLGMSVCVDRGYVRTDVEQALLDTFSTRAFFAPDSWTFAQPVYLSRIVAEAMGVPGVARVEPTEFQRFGEAPHGELAAGRIDMGRLEIAQLLNDPSFPESGRIDLDMAGGL
jgi:hypothetical protein